MRESHLKLRDKTIVLFGPLNLISQGITTVLTEMGANIAFIYNDIQRINKFVENTNLSREANPNIGKALAIEATLESKENITDIFSQVAEYFGTIDVIVDSQLTSQLWLKPDLQKDTTQQYVKKHFAPSKYLIAGGLPYLTGRKKGRFIILYYNASCNNNEAQDIKELTKTQVDQLISEYSELVIASQVTINALAIGPTEDFILQNFGPDQPLKEGIATLKKSYPKAKLVEAIDIANATAFIASPMSIGINSTTIDINYGVKTGAKK